MTDWQRVIGLFGAPQRTKALLVIYKDHPHEIPIIRIALSAKTEITTLHNSLRKLERAGLIKSRKITKDGYKIKVWSTDQNCRIHNELCALARKVLKS